MIKLNGTEVKPTIFPDNTSQIWQLDETQLNMNPSHITFDFENEAECMHLFQLLHLLNTYKRNIYLNMKYLPYARQDKSINNDSTFALRTFFKVLRSFDIYQINVLDPHSDVMFDLLGKYTSAKNISPDEYIKDAFVKSGANTIAYPDDGAAKRYYVGNLIPIITGHKNRDQQTGYIKEYNIEGNPKDREVLIVDDICDGGMTFKLMAEELYKQGAKSVHLYCTHGIFSKGLTTLRDSGIKRVFTHEGEVDEFFEPNDLLIETELENV